MRTEVINNGTRQGVTKTLIQVTKDAANHQELDIWTDDTWIELRLGNGRIPLSREMAAELITQLTAILG